MQLSPCTARSEIVGISEAFRCLNVRVRSRRGLVTATVCAGCLYRQETRTSEPFGAFPIGPRLRVGFVTPNLVLGGAEYWILGLLKYCDPSRIKISGVVVMSSDACEEAMCRRAAEYAPLYGGPLSRPGIVHDAEDGFVQRFPTSSDALGRLCDDSDVIVVWGVAHLGKHLSGLAYRGQVVLVSHGAGHWTETMLRTSKEAADRLVGVSAVAAEAFQTPGVSVIHNGADGERCQVTLPRDAIRQEWGVTSDEKLVGYVGRFSWEKNPSAAALAVRELGRPFRAVYLGGGWKEKEVRASVSEVAPDAIFLPPREDIGNVLNALDVLVLASPSEGFSLSLTEAWLCGLPAVATRVGAVPELEAIYGQLVTPVPVRPSAAQLAAAVRQALSAENRAVVEQAKRVAWENYTAKAMGNRWTMFLIEAAASAGSLTGIRHIDRTVLSNP